MGTHAVATERPERFFHTRLARLSLPALLLGSLIAMPAAAQRVGGEGQAHLGALWPAEPPARICGNTALLSNPDPMPANAVRVPAGDNSNIDFRRANTTFWFEPGVHTFSDDIYGQIIAQDNNVYLGAPGAILDGQNKNLYAFTNAARNVTIRYLTIRNFGRGRDNFDQAVVNHDAGDHWTVEYNTIIDNDGAGVFLGSHNTVRFNCLKDNGQYGFSMYKPPVPSTAPQPGEQVPGRSAIVDIELSHNEITGNNTDDWETSTQCGCTGGGKFWDVGGAKVVSNYVHGNHGTGLWADTNNIDFLFEGNYIKDNDGVGLWYEISYNATIRSNTFINNAWASGNRDTGSPAPAIYLSESGGDSRLASAVSGSTQLRVQDNYFENNFSGITIYENANRFCNSNGNTSSTYCTPFVHPSVITRPDPAHPSVYPDPVSNLHPCYTDIGGDATLKANCRWRAQNIEVSNNEFYFDPAVVPCGSSGYCGAQALYATGTDNIAWSPYTVQQVQQDVMFNNNNRFSNNHYYGPWRFAKRYGEAISFPVWRAAPYLQDAGSTTDGALFNVIDTPTATLEASAGLWSDWYGAQLARVGVAHGGAYGLQVTVDDSYWGVQVANHPGYRSDGGSKRLSFWVKHASGTPLPTGNARVQLRWAKEDGSAATGDPDTSVSNVYLPALSGDWQQVVSDVVPPPATASVWIVVVGSGSAGIGASFYLDDLVLQDTPL